LRVQSEYNITVILILIAERETRQLIVV